MAVRLFFLMVLTAGICGQAWGQGFSVTFMGSLDENFGVVNRLTEGCSGSLPDPNAAPIQDSVVVFIYWDQNSNGPDADDMLAPVGFNSGDVNYHAFFVNGCYDIGECGTFY